MTGKPYTCKMRGGWYWGVLLMVPLYMACAFSMSTSPAAPVPGTSDAPTVSAEVAGSTTPLPTGTSQEAASSPSSSPSQTSAPWCRPRVSLTTLTSIKSSSMGPMESTDTTQSPFTEGTSTSSIDITETTASASIGTHSDITETSASASTSTPSDITETSASASTSTPSDITETTASASIGTHSDITETSASASMGTPSDITGTTASASIGSRSDITETTASASMGTHSDITGTTASANIGSTPAPKSSSPADYTGTMVSTQQDVDYTTLPWCPEETTIINYTVTYSEITGMTDAFTGTLPDATTPGTLPYYTGTSQAVTGFRGTPDMTTVKMSSDTTSESLTGTPPDMTSVGMTGTNPDMTSAGMTGTLPDMTSAGMTGTLPDMTSPGMTGTLPDMTSAGMTGSPPDITSDGMTGTPPGMTSVGMTGTLPGMTSADITSDGMTGTPPYMTSVGMTGTLPDMTSAGMTGTPPDMTSDGMTGTPPGMTSVGMTGTYPDMTSVDITGTPPDMTSVGMTGTNHDMTSASMTGTHPAMTSVGMTGTPPDMTSASMTGTNSDMTSASMSGTPPDMTSVGMTGTNPDMTSIGKAGTSDTSPVITHTNPAMTPAGMTGTPPDMTSAGMTGTNPDMTSVGITGTPRDMTSVAMTGTNPDTTLVAITGTPPDMTSVGVTGTNSDMTSVGMTGTLPDMTSAGMTGTPPAMTPAGMTGTPPDMTSAGMTGTNPDMTSVGITGTPPDMTSVAMTGTNTDMTSVAMTGTNTDMTSAGMTGTSPGMTSVDMTGTNPDTTLVDITGTPPDMTSVGVTGTNSDMTSVGMTGTNPDMTSVDMTGTNPDMTSAGMTGTNPEMTSVGMTGTNPEMTSAGMTGTHSDMTSVGFMNGSTSPVMSTVTTPRQETTEAIPSTPEQTTPEQTTPADGLIRCLRDKQGMVMEVSCKQGYIDTSTKDMCICSDINECNATKTVPEYRCDDSNRAICINTEGNYTCTCNASYEGSGDRGSCNKTFTVSFLKDGHKKITRANSQRSAESKAVASELICAPLGIPCGNGRITNCLRILSNGVVTGVDGPLSGERLYANPKPTGANDKLSDLILDPQDVFLLAVYWANSKILSNETGVEENRGVYWSTIEGPENITQMFAELPWWSTTITSKLRPQWAVVATWWKLHIDDQSPEQTASYQLIFLTDYTHTVGVVYYGDRQMNWDWALNIAEKSHYPVRVGVKSGDWWVEHPASHPPTANRSHIERMDDTVRRLTSSDYYIMHVTNPNATIVNPLVQCQEWLMNDTNKSSSAIPDWATNGTVATVCPDSLDKVVRLDKETNMSISSWEVINNFTEGDTTVTCYSVQRTLPPEDEMWAPRCCYTTSGPGAGSLRTDNFTGCENLATRYKPNTEGYRVDREACKSCCSPPTDKLCYMYRQRRPKCVVGPPAAVAAVEGDPHIVTQDGLAYTFNGLGEYTLYACPTFTAQGRTKLVPTTNPPPRATYFSAFVAQQSNVRPGINSDKIMFQVNESEIVIYRNDTIVNVLDGQNNAANDVTVTRLSNSKAIMKFSNLIAITVWTTANMSYVSFVMPADFRGNCSGIMGNYDGNKFNDITYKNGTVISSNSSEEEIFEAAQTWMIDPAESLFTYEENENASTYGNRSFVPLFFDLATMFPDNASLTSAINTCGSTDKRECLFDVALTGNEDVGTAILSSQEDFSDFQNKLANYAPEIQTNISSLDVPGGVNQYTLTIDASDKNEGDTLTFALSTGGPTGLEIVESGGRGLLTWGSVPQSALPDTMVTVIVSDGSVTASLTLAINVCLCQNGTCVYEEAVGGVVPCDCNPGYEGDQCDTDIDGCADTPCYTGVKCTDKLAPLSGFQCDECPAGLVGDGSICIDLNECKAGTSGCSHECTNLPGSFLCQCPAGHVLKADLRNCQEIDECSRNPLICGDPPNTCLNTVGSFECKCPTGYTDFDTSNQANCIDRNECDDGNVQCGANEQCVNTPGSYVCACKTGYERDDQNNCANIDECQLGHDCDQNCMDGIASYTCSCNTGFFLDSADNKTCKPQKNCTETQATGCKKTGDAEPTCAVVNGEAICQCPAKYRLDPNNFNECKDLNECSQTTNPCNAATSTCQNYVGGFNCTCKNGYKTSPNSENKVCEDISECTETDPSTNAYLSGCDYTNGYCVNTEGSFTCACKAGYELDGKTCTDTNECKQAALNDCDPDYGVCTNKDGGYTCSCDTGFTGDGFICSDENECALPDRGGCEQGCQNSIGSFSCYCGNGYYLNDNGKTCEDFNECSQDTENLCYDSIDHCENTPGTYKCSCPAGLKLEKDGYTCTTIVECANTTNCSDICLPVLGVDICKCNPGRRLKAGSNNTCEPINECLSNDTNRCQAEKNVMCVDLPIGYQCNCTNSTYYTQLSEDSCDDIDECLKGTANCPLESICINEERGYRCQCKAGYELKNGLCTDIDECSTGNHTCDELATCGNEPGTYNCTCNAGYEGSGFKGKCSDINECADGNNGGCDVKRGRGTCFNFAGGHNCTCFSGYKLDDDNHKCDDLNECNPQAKLHDCAQQCDNKVGGYACSCNPGFILGADGKNCTVAEECSANNTCSQLCAVINTVETCSCRNSSYELDKDNATCIDVDECATSMPCVGGNTTTCNNTIGGYVCACIAGYALATDGLTCEVDTDSGGVLSQWTSWGCQPPSGRPCGRGNQMRTRTCSPDGTCDGTLSETGVECLKPCEFSEIEQQNGVLITISGITPTQFETAMVHFKSAIVNATNDKCQTATYFTRCCAGRGSRQSSDDLEYTNTSNVHINNINLNKDNKTECSLLIIVPANNDLCADGSQAPATNRRKRAAIAFDNTTQIALPQDVLQAFVQSSNAELVAAIKIAYPNLDLDLGVSMVGQTTSAPVSTTVSIPTAKSGMAGWLIAIIVIIVIIILVIAVVIIVVLLKRPTKVHSFRQAPMDRETSYNVEMQEDPEALGVGGRPVCSVTPRPSYPGEVDDDIVLETPEDAMQQPTVQDEEEGADNPAYQIDTDQPSAGATKNEAEYHPLLSSSAGIGQQGAGPTPVEMGGGGGQDQLLRSSANLRTPSPAPSLTTSVGHA